MTLPAPITTYLTEQGIPHDDPDASFRSIGLDQLDMQEIALLIEEHAGHDVRDVEYEAWQTLADVVETARAFTQEVV